ncbi:hypothetical protein GCM10027418_20530 [Mariniluteicoccus endophyticus]
MLHADNPMRSTLMMTLIFEIIVFGLAVPVMIMVAQVPPLNASLAGAAGALLALAATMTLRRPQVGYPLGWLTQVAAVAMGFLTYGMFIMGAMFLVLWLTCFVLGRRLEAAAAERG